MNIYDVEKNVVEKTLEEVKPFTGSSVNTEAAVKLAVGLAVANTIRELGSNGMLSDSDKKIDPLSALPLETILKTVEELFKKKHK